MANFCTHGNDSYSYETCIRTTDHNGIVILNVTKYSKTTSKHQNNVLTYSERAIHLDNVPRGATADDLRRLASRKRTTFADSVVEALKHRHTIGAILEADIREAIKNAGG